MSTLYHDFTLIGPDGDRVSLRGMVNTGAHFTSVPGSVLTKIGVRPTRRMGVRFATGGTEMWPVGLIEAEILGQTEPIFVFFGPENGPILIGVHTLEAFPFAVDVSGQRLIPQDTVPMMDTHA
jgi:predicted aspartyl protease